MSVFEHKCPWNHRCCDKPQPEPVAHDCDNEKPGKPIGHICEGCAKAVCANCGSECDCEL